MTVSIMWQYFDHLGYWGKNGQEYHIIDVPSSADLSLLPKKNNFRKVLYQICLVTRIEYKQHAYLIKLYLSGFTYFPSIVANEKVFVGYREQ